MTEPRSPDPDRTWPVDPVDHERARRFSALVDGRRFANRYDLVRRLGAGGTGEVHLVHDTIADEDFALKVLYPGPVPVERTLLRMRRELRLVRDLDHPGIVRVFDIGESDGLLYVVMEHLEGESLRDRLERDGRLPPSEAVRIVRGLFTALEAAHARGVIHRDVKPGNVYLASGVDGSERVVLLDFGLARGVEDPRLTATGTLIGTPTYMSPEQADGREPTAAADLYSAGLVLWEMLHGGPPFDSDSAVELMKAHLASPLPRRGAGSRDVPRWLDRLTRWLLEKNPARRPGSARVALDWLDRRATPLRRILPRTRKIGRPVVVLAAAAAIAGVALWPVRTEIVDGEIVARSLSGIPVRSIAGDFGWTAAALSDEFPRGRYAIGGVVPGRRIDEPARNAYPTLLARVDLWTGASTPFSLRHGERPDRWPDFGFEGYAPIWSINSILPTAFQRVAGQRVYALVGNHHHHYPTGLLFVDALGRVYGEAGHPGRIYISTVDTNGAGEPRMLFLGMNNALGTRWSVFSVPDSRLGRMAMPPFDIDVYADRRPGFYVFLPVYARDTHASLRRDDDAIVLSFPDTGVVRLDPEDGMPLDPWLRDGVSPEVWRAAQHRLIDVLEASSRLAGASDPGAGAEALEEFVRAFEGSRIQHGVALGQASRLRSEAGDLEEAVRDGEEAMRLEPDIPGHVQAWLLAKTLSGEAGEAIARILAGDATPLRAPEVARDVVLAHLCAGDPEAAARTNGSLFPPKGSGRDFYRLLLPTAIALEVGDDESAREAASSDRYPHDSTIAFARALAWRRASDPGTALSWIAVARSTGGSGHRFPLDLLESWIRARSEGAAPDRDAIDRDLEEQRRAAARTMTDLWAYRWAERLHADLAP